MAEAAALKRETSFLDLNDDCLMEIFSWLPLIDLCTIRYMSSRLKKLTEEYFSRKHKSLNFATGGIKNFGYIETNEVFNILSTFGQQIDALTLNEKSFQAPSELLPKLDAFCKQHRLQHLKLVGFVFDDNFILSRTHPFGSVEKLTLDKCNSGEIRLDKLIEKCSTLRHLELIRYVDINGACLKQVYPMLQGFSVNLDGNLDSGLLKTFISKNTQLKDLNIVNCSGLDDSIFKVIGDHLSELESLKLRVVQPSATYNAKLMELLNLPKLRELEIECNYQDISAFLNGLSVKNQLESLGLSTVELKEDVCNAIGHMKSVKKLKLVSVYESKNSGSIRSFAAQLPLLKQFYVSSSDSLTFDDIVKFVENAPKLEDLMVTSCSSIIPFDEAQINRLVETCAKRVDKLKLTVHSDSDDLYDMKQNIGDEMKRNNSEIVRFVKLPPEVKDFTAFNDRSIYFAEEGGAPDFDFYDDDFDEYDGDDDYYDNGDEYYGDNDFE